MASFAPKSSLGFGGTLFQGDRREWVRLRRMHGPIANGLFRKSLSNKHLQRNRPDRDWLRLLTDHGASGAESVWLKGRAIGFDCASCGILLVLVGEVGLGSLGAV